MYVAWKEATLKTDTWMYDVHRTCAHTTAVLRGIRHLKTKQRCKYTSVADADVELHVLGCRVDILGANRDQCLTIVQELCESQGGRVLGCPS